MGAIASRTETRDYVSEALLYCEDVLDGTVTACSWVRMACARQIKDLERAAANDADFPYRFDVQAAARICLFTEKLPHIKGKWARQKQRIRLEAWQVFVLTTVFGWVHRDNGLRRFSLLYLEVARKNAKTTIAAGIALYMLLADGEPGAEVYSAATKKEQANIVFATAREMARRSPAMRNHYGLTVQQHKLLVNAEASEFRALDAKGTSLDGLNIHCDIKDEVHAWKGRDLYEVIDTAKGARSQPLSVDITTAGTDRSGICYEQRTYVTRILSGRDIDETVFGLIYTLDDGDDWADESVWIKANPNLGVSVSIENLRAKVAQAVAVASKRNGILTKHFNVWTNAAHAWMDMTAWERCKDETLTLKNFAGKEAIAAFDLATRKDIASRILWFVDEDTGEHTLLARHYCPQAAVDEKDNASYAGWVADGWLTATPGNVTDQIRIKDDVLGDAETVKMTELVFDRWQAAKLMSELIDDGFEVIDLTNSVVNMSEPMKEFEALVLSGKLRHQGDPVLTWMVSNVCCRLDEKDNIFPIKETKDSRNKIDGAVAAIMGLNRVLARRETFVPSPFDTDDEYEVAVQ